ncbi:unnamed protein product [Meganyctiphanes norvegica]|uniref:Uncharacterized protein n=1 Tax=Meganyctiphanes norvegica TaxID=48144 RepID=A0AAV2Q9R3_MEGNR
MRVNGRISVYLHITFSLTLYISHCDYYLYMYILPEHHCTHPTDKRGLDHGSYNHWLAPWSSNCILAAPTGQLKIFWGPWAAHRSLTGPLGQPKIIGRPLAANIQFYLLRFEKPYMTVAHLRG